MSVKQTKLQISFPWHKNDLWVYCIPVWNPYGVKCGSGSQSNFRQHAFLYNIWLFCRHTNAPSFIHICALKCMEEPPHCVQSTPLGLFTSSCPLFLAQSRPVRDTKNWKCKHVCTHASVWLKYFGSMFILGAIVFLMNGNPWEQFSVLHTLKLRVMSRLCSLLPLTPSPTSCGNKTLWFLPYYSSDICHRLCTRL